MAGLRFSLSFLLSIWMLLPQLANAAEHTNQCIRNLGGISACQDRGWLGLPNDIQACCDGVRQLAVDSCHCSPTIDAILGEEGSKLWNIEVVCRVAQPKQWAKISPLFLKQCDAVNEAHTYGCEKSDVQIDGERMQAITKFGELFTPEVTKEKNCLDTPGFAKKLARSMTDDVHFNVPYGIGTYKGHQGVAEYLGMAYAGLTHGFWQHDPTPDPKKRARLEVSADGSTWFAGHTGKGNFLRGRLPYQDLYLENKAEFRACETKVHNYTVLPTDGLAFVIERIVQTAELSKRWGIEDICRYHTSYCADDPQTRQYESEAACIDYMRSLPLYTVACGRNRPLNGHSLGCKYKHHFMIPANPKLHCSHIGPKGSLDPNAHLKCDDEAECSKDEGQDAWPPVRTIGEAVPAQLQKLFEESNADFENEPFGCAVPSEDTGEGHHH